MRPSPPQENETVDGLKFERLQPLHFLWLRNNPSIYRGRHRNTLGGGLSDQALREKLRMSGKDWKQYENGQLPGGHYWLVLKDGRPVAISGFHKNDRSGQIFIQRMFLEYAMEASTILRVIERSLLLFTLLRPEQICVQTNAVHPQAYIKAGYQLLARGHMFRQGQKAATTDGSARHRPRRKRPMCLLVRPLMYDMNYPGPKNPRALGKKFTKTWDSTVAA